MRAPKSLSYPSSLRLLRAVLEPRVSSHARPWYPFLAPGKQFHTSRCLQVIRSHILTDIGEGTKEVQLNQWYVEEGAHVEEWANLCEVQSDKASVDITSKYAGVIKKLYFEQNAVVQVGDVMLDIEVEGEEDEANVEHDGHKEDNPPEAQAAKNDAVDASKAEAEQKVERPAEPQRQPGKHASLATPAVRGMLKEHSLAIEDIKGTGKDGRVLKEDIQKHISHQNSESPAQSLLQPQPPLESKQTETAQQLTPVQSAMFRAMTASLSIPHFLYSSSTNFSSLTNVRQSLNSSRDPANTPKLSYLPFIIKAVSLALNQYPLLNSRLDTTSSKPQLQLRSSHNIGVAMDTPAGLLVPVIKSANLRSITSIASELQRLAALGKAGKLSSADLSGGTITVSNIGSIGGDVVAPVIVEGQLAILGVGKIRAVPVFGKDGKSIERAEMVGMSWSADHRVVDGATMARVAECVSGYLEEPGKMILDMV